MQIPISLVQLLEQTASEPVGGRLANFWKKWQAIDAPIRVVRWLRNGYPLPFLRNEQGRELKPKLVVNPHPSFNQSYAHNREKQRVLDDMIADLLSKKAIEEVPADQPGFYSRVFLIPKRSKTGGWRLILDLSALNQYLRVDGFNMDTNISIRNALCPGMWATSIDLKDAYHHIPIRQRSRIFLCFQVRGKKYWFLVLPFGLATAPMVFSEVMKVLKKWGRLSDILLFQYLDDWMAVHMSKLTVFRQTLRLVKKCLDLGLIVHPIKSELIPSQRLIFLGEQLDFQVGRVFPTTDRCHAIQSQAAVVLRNQQCKVLLADSLLGLLVATERTVPLGRILYRPFQAEVVAHTKQGRFPHALMQLSRQAKNALRWWMVPSHLAVGSSLASPRPTLQFQTDASPYRWGVFCQGQTWQGPWSGSDVVQHINYLELRALEIACKLLCGRIEGLTVKVLMDNATAVAYIKKQGGTRSPNLNVVTRRILMWAHAHRCQLLPVHLAGSLNVVADLASRVGHIVSTEWALTTPVFSWVSSQSPWGPPTVDLFANSLNHRLPKYFSPCPDEEAFQVNALIGKWPSEVLYAFPPSTIMDKVLLKITEERCQRLLLVAPKLVEARWFPTLMGLPIISQTKLQLVAGDLVQPHWQHGHQRPMLFNLHLYCINFTT